MKLDDALRLGVKVGDKIVYPLEYLHNYIFLRKIQKGKTTEETLNNILIDLFHNQRNFSDGPHRSELISCCAIIAFALPREKIKDPFTLYKNLANAFFRWGPCIFTKTVKKAFIKLQDLTIMQGRGWSLVHFIFGHQNQDVRRIVSSNLPKAFLYNRYSVAHRDDDLALLESKLSKDEAYNLLQRTIDAKERSILIAALIKNPETKKTEIIQIVRGAKSYELTYLLQGLSLRFDLTQKDLQIIIGDALKKIGYSKLESRKLMDYRDERIRLLNRGKLSQEMKRRTKPARYIGPKRINRPK